MSAASPCLVPPGPQRNRKKLFVTKKCNTPVAVSVAHATTPSRSRTFICTKDYAALNCKKRHPAEAG